MFAALDLFNIKYKLLNNTKDIWARDYMPVKTKSGKYVSFRYEPSYLDDVACVGLFASTGIAAGGLYAS